MGHSTTTVLMQRRFVSRSKSAPSDLTFSSTNMGPQHRGSMILFSDADRVADKAHLRYVGGFLLVDMKSC